MKKTKFTEAELEQIKAIQEKLSCTRKTAVRKFKQSQEAAKVDVKKAAANDRETAVPAATLTPEERGAARAEGLRLYKLAGKPKKSDFIKVFGKKGVAWTWAARAKAVELATAEECAAKFQSLLKRAGR